MNTEQQFVDLIKEGKVADAMQLIKQSLTEMAGSSIVESKFSIAEKYGMKKKEMKEEDDEEMGDDDKSKSKSDDEDDEEMDEGDKKKKKMKKQMKEAASDDKKWSDIFDREIAPEVLKSYDADDTIAFNQAFNDWTDALSKDGEISSDVINSLEYIGKYSD